MGEKLSKICNIFEEKYGSVVAVYNVESTMKKCILVLKCINNSYYKVECSLDDEVDRNLYFEKIDIFDFLEENDIDTKNDLTKVYTISNKKGV